MPRVSLLITALVCALGIGSVGCSDGKKGTKGKTGKAVKGTVAKKPVAKVDKDPALADIPFDASAADDPARMPRKPEKEPIEVVVRAILVSHAKAAKSTSARKPKAAKRRAARIVAAARKKGVDFAKLAAMVSDEPPAKRSELRTFHRGPLAADRKLIDGALALGVGQVSDPIATAGGIWVLARVEPEEYSTAHILVQYQGAKLSKPAMTRDKAKAKALAEGYAKQAKAGKESFFVLAGRYSDSPSKVRGGVITPLRPERMIPGFEPYLAAVRKLKPGEVSDVVETPYGFHVIKRLPLQKIMVRHILIRYTDAAKPSKEPRSKAKAKELAGKLMLKLKRHPERFVELAKKRSEDDSAKDGGLMAPFARGQMLPRFEQFAFALKLGQVSDVVASKFGFHVIKRER